MTLLQGLVTLEPKKDFMFRHGVRVMNSVHEVRSNATFATLVSNFSTLELVLKRGMVIAFGSRSPLALIEVDGGAA